MDRNVQEVEERGRAERINETHLQVIYIDTTKMNSHIQTIIELTGCSEDDAMRVYAETNDVEDAIDKILPPAKNAARKYYEAIKPVRTYTEQEKQIKILRDELKKMDDVRLTSLNPRGFVAPNVPNILREETVQQSNCDQECQLPVLQSEAQIPEIVCLLPSECSSDSQSNGRT
jgi:hypothetical protein